MPVAKRKDPCATNGAMVIFTTAPSARVRVHVEVSKVDFVGDAATILRERGPALFATLVGGTGVAAGEGQVATIAGSLAFGTETGGRPGSFMTKES